MPRLTFRERLFAKILIDRDDPGACWMWTGSRNHKGYGHIWDGTYTPAGHPRPVKAHCAVYEIYHGPITPGKQVDHICHVRECVNPQHLREVTPKENAENRAGAQRGSRSGVRGVHWNKQCGKWQVNVGHNGRIHYGGLFDDLNEAAEAARALRNRLFTHNDTDRQEGAA